MADTKIKNEEGLRSLFDYIKRMLPLLEPEFGAEKHKIIFHRNDVLPNSWAQFPISQISTARFIFYGFFRLAGIMPHATPTTIKILSFYSL